MKAGSTLVFQVLSAATQLSGGMDCEANGSSLVAAMVGRREAPLEHYVQMCYDELFRWELVKDPMATHAVHRLADAWPALSHGQMLKLYFVVRNPLDCTRSFVRHLGVATRLSSPEEQQFSWGELKFPQHFTVGKQGYLDVSLHGLNYTGYVDAVVQRWALMVDEYLVCPDRFALVRYEDFIVDPISQARRILNALELSELWSPGAEDRVKVAAAAQYQTSSGRGGGPSPSEVFGEPLLSRIITAVRSRAELLGYAQFVRSGVHSGDHTDMAGRRWPPIEMPPIPRRTC